MIKSEELVSGCMAKAHETEMTFVLLARDKSAPFAIREWARHRVASGKNYHSDEQIQEAFNCANVMEQQYVSFVEKKLQDALEKIADLQDEIRCMPRNFPSINDLQSGGDSIIDDIEAYPGRGNDTGAAAS
jgi:hypothetical protein